MIRIIAAVSSIIALALLAATPVSAREKLPEVSHDGLHLMEHTKLRAVYVKPGASLAQYDKVALLDCFVSFQKNWERNYNDDVVGIGRRITKDDMARIKTKLAAEFKKVFSKQLDKGGYPTVTYGAEDVLILRPAIINLDVTAPDTRSPGMSTTVVASAGQMTLYLELYDSVTSDIIARIIDPEAGRQAGMAQVANSATNKEAADQILRYWAGTLVSHLDAAHKNTRKEDQKENQEVK